MTDQIVLCRTCRRRNRVPPAAAGSPRCGNCHRPLPWITHANDGTFTAFTQRSSTPVVVHIWAVWCPPCRRVGPALEHLAADLAGRLKLVRVNIEAAPLLVERFAVRAVPTLMIMDHGQVTARVAGAARADEIRRWLEAALADTGPTGRAEAAPGLGAPRSQGSRASG